MISCALLSYGFGHHLFPQAVELNQRFKNYRMVTSLFVGSPALARVGRIAPPLARRLARRSDARVPARIARTYPIELAYQLAARALRQPYSYFAAHDRMARRITRDFAPPRAVIAIDTGAEALFRAWHGRSRCVLDLSIAVAPYREKIFRDAEQHPASRGISFHYPGEWELRRYAAETQLADLILCPSEFVMESCRFLGVPESRLRLLPYGFDPGVFRPAAVPPSPSEPLRMVFVGTFCTRKGSHLLLPAFSAVRAAHADAELHVFGDIQDRPEREVPGVVFHGRVPQPTLATQLRKMHVMAFPTLFEGSSYAVYQALASGVPVVTTRNCGSIVDDTCGIVLREPSASLLEEALLRCACDRAGLARRAAAAPKRAQDYTWARYGERVQRILVEAFPELSEEQTTPMPDAAPAHR